jgi:hypothetical protein
MTKMELFNVYKNGSDYYFQIAKNPIRGPFVDEIEAYQEATRDLIDLLKSAYKMVMALADENEDVRHEAFKEAKLCKS